MRAVTPVLLMLLVACSDPADPSPTDAATPPVDAPVDAPQDARPDVTVDAGPNADAAPVCTEAGRFTFEGDGGPTLARDAKGGLVWRRQVTAASPAFSPNACAAAGFRSPTVAELTALVLPGCVPSLDADVFTGMPFGGDTYATDGCVDMATGKASAVPCVGFSGVHMLCVVP